MDEFRNEEKTGVVSETCIFFFQGVFNFSIPDETKELQLWQDITTLP